MTAEVTGFSDNEDEGSGAEGMGVSDVIGVFDGADGNDADPSVDGTVELDRLAEVTSEAVAPLEADGPALGRLN